MCRSLMSSSWSKSHSLWLWDWNKWQRYEDGSRWHKLQEAYTTLWSSFIYLWKCRTSPLSHLSQTHGPSLSPIHHYPQLPSPILWWITIVGLHTAIFLHRSILIYPQTQRNSQQWLTSCLISHSTPSNLPSHEAVLSKAINPLHTSHEKFPKSATSRLRTSNGCMSRRPRLPHHARKLYRHSKNATREFHMWRSVKLLKSSLEEFFFACEI